MSSKTIIKICTELKLALYGEVKNINLSTHHVTKLFSFRFQEKLKRKSIRNSLHALPLRHPSDDEILFNFFPL